MSRAPGRFLRHAPAPAPRLPPADHRVADPASRSVAPAEALLSRLTSQMERMEKRLDRMEFGHDAELHRLATDDGQADLPDGPNAPGGGGSDRAHQVGLDLLGQAMAEDPLGYSAMQWPESAFEEPLGETTFELDGSSGVGAAGASNVESDKPAGARYRLTVDESGNVSPLNPLSKLQLTADHLSWRHCPRPRSRQAHLSFPYLCQWRHRSRLSASLSRRVYRAEPSPSADLPSPCNFETHLSRIRRW